MIVDYSGTSSPIKRRVVVAGGGVGAGGEWEWEEGGSGEIHAQRAFETLPNKRERKEVGNTTNHRYCSFGYLIETTNVSR